MFQTPLTALSLAVTAAVGAALLEAEPAEAASPEGPTCHGVTATIVGSASDDRLRGTPERDVILGLGGADRIHGRGGNDLVCAGAGADFLRGGSGADRLYAGSGADTVVSSPGDRAVAGRGGDTAYAHADGHLQAGRGRDWVTAHPSAHVRTGAGDDALDISRMGRAVGTLPRQVLLGGSGTDAVRVMGNNEGDAVVIDLRAGTATSVGVFGTFAGFEDAIGDLGNDVLIGDAGPNRLLGYWGEDRIRALGGDDLVDGQEEEDTLDGGRGEDRCSVEVAPPTNCESIVEDPAPRTER